MRGIFSTLAIVWRIASPYFYSEDRWPGRILLAAVIAIELAIVGINVLLNSWNNTFYNALQDKNWDAFIYQLGYFCVLATIFILLAVYQLYLNQWLQIRWRRWLTRTYLDHWLADANHYRMQLLGDAADNPDQRIAEDVKQFIDAGPTGIGILPIGLGLLNSVVTLGSFAVILWNLSGTAPLHLFGTTWAIPGYLFWAALIYAIIGTALTHLVGRALTALNFQQQRYEADFRFNLVRVRENSEQIALLDGEQAERDRLLVRFGNVVANWLAIMTRQKKLTFLTAGYGQVSSVFPFVVVSPAYFAGAIQLGGLMQTASAFGSVQGALSFFVTVLSAARRMACGGRKARRVRRIDRRCQSGRDHGACHHACAERRKRGELQGPGGAIAEWHTIGQRQRRFNQARRARAGERSFRFRQVDAVSRTGRSLAVWRWHNHRTEKCARDDPAAAALLSDRAACRRGRISG